MSIFKRLLSSPTEPIEDKKPMVSTPVSLSSLKQSVLSPIDFPELSESDNSTASTIIESNMSDSDQIMTNSDEVKDLLCIEV